MISRWLTSQTGREGNSFTYRFAGTDGAQDGGVRGEGTAVDAFLVPPQHLHHVTCGDTKPSGDPQSPASRDSARNAARAPHSRSRLWGEKRTGLASQ